MYIQLSFSIVEKQKSAGAIIYVIENEKPLFLLLQNTLKNTYWEFPKGKIENKESIKETVKREISEETCLNKLFFIPGFQWVLKWFYQFEGKTIFKETIYLLAKIKTQEKSQVKINHEHEKFEWIPYEKAMQKLKKKANKEMLKKANQVILEYEKQKKLF